MSFIIDGIMSHKLPWGLVLLGAAIALVLQMSGISALIVDDSSVMRKIVERLLRQIDGLEAGAFRSTTRAGVPNYIAVGPIFATLSKANPDPVVGTGLIRRVRGLTDKPIVAIGGITVETAAQVIEAGADSVAVIGDILRALDRTQRARQYLEVLGAAHRAASV